MKRNSPKNPKVELPDGAIGKDLAKKNYMTYLIKRYEEWKGIELKKKGEPVEYGIFRGTLMKRYKVAGINHIPVERFDDLVSYIKDRIDKTTFGRNRKAKSLRNYSTFEEHQQGIEIDVNE